MLFGWSGVLRFLTLIKKKVLFILYGGPINGIERLYKFLFSRLLKLSEFMLPVVESCDVVAGHAHVVLEDQGVLT